MFSSTKSQYCMYCGKEMPLNASFCSSCGQPSKPQTPTMPLITFPSSVNCHFHPATRAVGSCSKCGKPACNVCLVTKGGFLTGASQVCRLCIRYESALNWSGGIALVLFLVLTLATLNVGLMVLWAIIALVVFLLTRKELRKRARRELEIRTA